MPCDGTRRRAKWVGNRTQLRLRLEEKLPQTDPLPQGPVFNRMGCRRSLVVVFVITVGTGDGEGEWW